MNCSKCGKKVKEGAKFCVGCGTPLTDTKVEVEKTSEVREKVAMKVTEVKENVKKAADSDFMKVVLSSLLFLLNILLKPIKTLKSKIEFYSKPQNGFILAGVVALATMVVNVVMTFVMALLKKDCTPNFFSAPTCLSIGDKLKQIDWMGITLKHLLIMLIAMFAIAGIYYIACLIAKKSVNFMRLLTITAVSFIPASVAMYVLVPIFGWIHFQFGVIFLIIGMIYSLVVFFSAMSDEIKFDNNDTKLYFNLICISLIMIILYFIGYNVAVNSVNNAVGSLSSLNF